MTRLSLSIVHKIMYFFRFRKMESVLFYASLLSMYAVVSMNLQNTRAFVCLFCSRSGKILMISCHAIRFKPLSRSGSTWSSSSTAEAAEPAGRKAQHYPQ